MQFTNQLLPINWYGTYILTTREIKRFFEVYNQTIIAPVLSAMIFLAVFILALGKSVHNINGIKFINFMGYGLIIMTIVQNAFANSSSSIIMSKILGYISDLLVTPFSGLELVIAYSLGSLVRGIVVGLAVSICLIPFVDFVFYHPKLLVFFVVSSCLFLGQLGILTGVISKSFDQNAAVTSYIVSPLSFLSGTFYSVEHLPEIFRLINHFNPFFYIIDGFRYCLTNHADGSITAGIITLVSANIVLFFLLSYLLTVGWRIRD